MLQGEGIVVAAALMGLAGLPHCAAMCAVPCAAVASRGGASAQPLFQASRIAGYAAAGALAAWSVGALREGLTMSPVLRPLWTLLHLAALAFGLWMLWRGRWPDFLQRRVATPAPPTGWQRVAGPARSVGAGALWIAWPCALSQSALLVAALGSTPGQGAAAMTAFAVASSPALWLGPLVMQRMGAWRAGASLVAGAWPMRAAGAMIALGSLWALSHGLWTRFAAWCGLPL
jgi:sulfite exporter TauE/SafE